MRFFVEDSVFGYRDISNNISNKFSNIFKRKSQKNRFSRKDSPFFGFHSI